MLKLIKAILRDECGTTLAMTRKVSNTLITSSGFNTNWDEIEAVVNGNIDGDNFGADAVAAVNLNPDVVRTNYGLIQHTDGSLYVDVSDTNPCLELSDGGLRVKVDGSSIERAAGGLQVKAGGITAAMLAGTITDNLLSQITTASKVSGTSFTGLASIPAGAGVIPAANIPDYSYIGTRVDKSSSYGAQVAATAGIVTVKIYRDTSTNRGIAEILTDAAATPTTSLAKIDCGWTGAANEAGQDSSVSVPVKKGDYWMVSWNGIGTITVSWTPLGT